MGLYVHMNVLKATLTACVVICSLSIQGFVVTSCPCSEARFCERITGTPKKEIFVFSTLKPTQDDYLYFGWDKITTVVMVEDPDVRIVCEAHKHGARASSYIAYAPPLEVLTNKTARSSWIQEQLATVDTQQTTIDVPWSPHHIDQKYYDYVGLSEAADFMYLMEYEEASQIPGDCIASANSGHPNTMAGTTFQVGKHKNERDYNLTGRNSGFIRDMTGIQGYLNLGISPDMLVIGLPWFGYNYPCLSITKDGTYCSLEGTPWRGSNCSDYAGTLINYSDILQLLKNSTTGRIFDAETQSPYLNYLNQTTGAYHQVWYDDPPSLKRKYDYAVGLNVRGVGMWNTNSVNYESKLPEDIQAVREMWGLLPQY